MVLCRFMDIGETDKMMEFMEYGEDCRGWFT
jgi:hypothetical protein